MRLTLRGGRGRLRRMAAAHLITISACGLSAASASALSAHGQRLHLVPKLSLHANQSNNWFGYNQGALEQGGKLFNSITGQWTVPTATQHTAARPSPPRTGSASVAAAWTPDAQ